MFRERSRNRNRPRSHLCTFTAGTLVVVTVGVMMFSALPFLSMNSSASSVAGSPNWRLNSLLLALFTLGGVAVWAKSEAVLPAYTGASAIFVLKDREVGLSCEFAHERRTRMPQGSPTRTRSSSMLKRQFSSSFSNARVVSPFLTALMISRCW